MAYQRRMNILSTIVHNDSKVKEILSEQDENFDAIENIYLFGEQFEVSLQKLLQQSRNWNQFLLVYRRNPQAVIMQHQKMNTSLFERTFCLKNNKGETGGKDSSSVGWLSEVRTFYLEKPQRTLKILNSKVISWCLAFDKSQQTFQQTSTFCEKLGEVNKRPIHFKGSPRLRNPIFVKNFSENNPKRDLTKSRKDSLSGLWNSGNVKKTKTQ